MKQLIIVAALLCACGGKKQDKQVEAGPLTIERVLGAKSLVKPFDPWDEGFAKLQAQLGAPTRIDGTRHIWAVIEGDACGHFYVTKDNGADYKVEGTIVGTVQSPQRTSKDGAIGDHENCLAAAGQSPPPRSQ